MRSKSQINLSSYLRFDLKVNLSLRMSIKNCPKCQEKILPDFKFDDIEICSSCGWTSLDNYDEYIIKYKADRNKKKTKNKKVKQKKSFGILYNITNIIVSLLMFLLSGYAVWFAYNQINLDNEQRAKDSKENQKILQEAKDYNAQLKLEIDTIGKDVKQLQDELTATFGSNFSDTTTSKNYTKEKYLEIEYSQAEHFYAKCLAALNNSPRSKDDIQLQCLKMVVAHYPSADYTRILDHMAVF